MWPVHSSGTPKEQVLLAEWWSEILDYGEEGREWAEPRLTVPREEVQETLAEAALGYDDLVAGGISEATALRLTSEVVRRAPRSLKAQTVAAINAILEQLPSWRRVDPIPLEEEVKVPFRPASEKIVEHARDPARASRKPERLLAPAKIAYPKEPPWIGEDPSEGPSHDPADAEFWRLMRLLGEERGASSSVAHRLPLVSMDDRRTV